MALSVAGIGSGLDVESIISALMDVEQIPLQRLQQKNAGYLTQISAYGQLRSALGSFQSAVETLKSFNDMSALAATSSDESVLTVTAGNDANIGTYDIQVDFLAVAQKMGSNAFADTDTTTVGNTGDKMTFTIGTESFTVEIGGMTLSEIQTAINDDTENLGVTAGIVKEDDSTYYLTLTADETGTDNAMSLSFTDSSDISITDPLGMVETQAADDAEITIDNTYTVVSASNTITDAIQGLTIELKDTSASAVQVSLSRSPSDMVSAVQAFATAYNQLSTTLTSLQNGELQGDSAVRLVQRQMRDIMGSEAATGDAYTYGFEVGLSFDKEGVMSVTTADLEDALATDVNAVVSLFADADVGLATQLDEMIDNVLATDGLIDAREEGLNSSIQSNSDAIEDMQVRLLIVEDRYRAQYTALDTLMAELQTTSDFLTQQLANLNNLLPANRDNN